MLALKIILLFFSMHVCHQVASSYNNLSAFHPVFSQGWPSSESACLPSMWPGFYAGRPGVMCFKFDVDTRLASRIFLLVLRFSSLQKNRHFKIPVRPFDQDGGPA